MPGKWPTTTILLLLPLVLLGNKNGDGGCRYCFCCSAFVLRTVLPPTTNTPRGGSGHHHCPDDAARMKQKKLSLSSTCTTRRRRTATTPLFLRRSSSIYSSPKNDHDEKRSDASTTTTRRSAPLDGLQVAVVGGGPSGLLLSHRLFQAGANVELYEQRSLFLPNDNNKQPQRSSTSSNRAAYALGVGIRGRTAIRTVPKLWEDHIRHVGYASERFILHAGPFQIRLRDETDGGGGATGSNKERVEPSLLVYQSDLCRALAQALQNKPGVKMHFDCGVLSLDLTSRTLTTTRASSSSLLQGDGSSSQQQAEPSSSSSSSSSFDLVVGCDGVNSIVRQELERIWPGFKATKDVLPGTFKAVRLTRVPAGLDDPTAVQLILPKSGRVTAFIEPTVNNECCLLLASGGGSNDNNATADDDDSALILSNTNVTQVEYELQQRFPSLWIDDNDPLLKSASQQLTSSLQTVGQASVVTCNTYHYANIAALCGDACHATGGVSGQGVNSALQDSARLADCLEALYDGSESSLQQALLTYSQLSVPEGKALYDLSFGPKPESGWKRFQYALKSALDVLFKGRYGIGELPLQTLLTTSLQSFADIRRARDRFYDEPFPDQDYWNTTLAELDATTTIVVQATTTKANAS